ncbi:hypothetical protein HZB60_09060 [candidate division KSB1 bacterium]|nr:hypothetical protein [candidate division KSB1 bacterium]
MESNGCLFDFIVAFAVNGVADEIAQAAVPRLAHLARKFIVNERQCADDAFVALVVRAPMWLSVFADFVLRNPGLLLDRNCAVGDMIEVLRAELEGIGEHAVKERHGLLEHGRIVEVAIAFRAQVMGETGPDDHDLPLATGLIARQNPGFRNPSEPDTVHVLNIRPLMICIKPLINKPLQYSYEDCRGFRLTCHVWSGEFCQSHRKVNLTY